MAQKVQVLLTDDLDGSEATQTVRFAWSGIEYEIDLNDKNHAAFEKAVGKYVDASRRIGGRSRTRKRSTSPDVDLAAVRAWAREAGYEVSARGRISSDILEAYQTAH